MALHTTTEKYLATLMKDRQSVRAYLPKRVSKQCVLEILDVARFAASGGNMQPWQVHVLFDDTITKLNGAITRKISENGFVENGDYQYYATELEDPYKERIKQSGQDLYQALNIGRRDTAKKREQKLKNFEFYGAPIGLIITMDRKLAQGSWIDMGMFLNALSLAIADRGLGCCLQASFSSYGNIVRNTLKLDADNLVICGVALGYEDTSHPINTRPKRRMSVDEFVEFYP